ncbi:MAG: tetratricopeptide repeat protein, partial [Verrucomicrobiota bacterium]
MDRRRISGFGQTAHFGFVNLDDDLYVYENGKVASGLTLQGVTWLFTHAECHFYHPLTMLSLMLDYQLHGLDAGGYHLTNVLIHAASAILLFLILRRMTGALWRSAFVAAVFAIHPLRVESVAWVSERKDVLATFFFMLTLGAYVRYARDPNSLGRYLTVAGLFGLGLLCKPTAVTLPFVLLLLDYWPLGRMKGAHPPSLKLWSTGKTDSGQQRSPGVPFWELVKEKIPILALAAAECVVTYFAVAEGNSVVSIANTPIPMRIGNVLVSYVIYLRQMVWPTGLAVFYPYPEKNHPFWEIGLAFLLLAVISGAVLAVWRKRPWLMAGWFWYLGMLVPAIGIVQVGVFAWAAADWSAGWKHRRVVWGSLMVAMIGALLVCGRKQTSYWRNNETLWKRALACTAANSLAHYNLGMDLVQKGNLAGAITQFQEALAINPADADAHYNLGNALVKYGKPEEAIPQYRKALEIKPDYVKARCNLGNALELKGDVDEAIAQYQDVLQLNPANEDAHYNLGVALFAKGDLDGAIAQYGKALEIKPDHEATHNNLGDALLKHGELDQAAAQYRKALEIKPDYAQPHFNLGVVLLKKGEMEQAIAEYKKALEIEPEYMEAHFDLGTALALKGHLDEAVAQYRKVLEIRPDYAEA